ncbi:unnamed protein product [Spirodela intermedia]|uniref:Peptidase A1 domain-containing protein n=1 Tax=Spirodela intermedia TaxID=51605 RepID=A0A7I8JZ62_SPIIN|nr:unnamed protein product [Spirodela intermedia]
MNSTCQDIIDARWHIPPHAIPIPHPCGRQQAHERSRFQFSPIHSFTHPSPPPPAPWLPPPCYCSSASALCSSSSPQRRGPRPLVLPIAKDAASLQYVARLTQRTPLVPLQAVVHLGGGFFWVDCERGYASSTYRPVRCRTAQCAAAQTKSCSSCNLAPRPGCNTNSCSFFPGNPFIQTSTSGEPAEDVLSVSSTDGSNPGAAAAVPDLIFGCGPSFLLEGLAREATGIAGLGRNRVSLPSQLAKAFSFRRRFALCLSSAVGVAFFGGGPYRLLPGIDVSKPLLYTPLLVNPVSTAGVSFKGEPSVEYFIGVTSVKINGKPVALNRTLLAIDKKTGLGGTKISTVNPYTVLESSIYRAVVAAFAKERTLQRVPPVKPFGFCFNSTGVWSTRVGPAVPQIDLVMQSDLVFWRIFGANSMVVVNEGVSCLAFVDGGTNPRTSIVVGGYQLEDNLLEFDLAASRLGFSSSLLFRQTTCANFNFTSTR